MGASQNDVQGALQEALENQSSAQDPDVIPAGGQQATTTEEAKQEARKLLKRVGSTDTETGQLKKDLENNAEASRQALIRAQQYLLSPEGQSTLFPSDQERANRHTAALLAPHPNVPQTGALQAEMGNLATEEAGEQQANRETTRGLIESLSGLPLQQQLSKINEALAGSKQKILEMQTKYNTELAKPAMTALGRMSTTPANQKANIPNSTFGKIALDQLGPKAYNNPGDPTSGFTDEYRGLVKQLNDAAVAEAKARAGIDETAISPEDHLAVASMAGVPADASQYGLPDVSHMSTKARQAYYKDEEAGIKKSQDEMGPADEQTRAALRALDEFQKLNQVTYTGKWNEPFYIGGAHAGPHGAGVDVTQEHGGLNANLFSAAMGFNGNIQTMQKDAAQVVGQAIPPKGFGRVTNRDLNLFQSGSIGVDKQKETNDHVAQALRIRLNNDLDRNMFMQAYAGVHRSLRGSEGAWNDYLTNNPIFDPTFDQQKNPAALPPLNPNRTPWQEYFKQKNGALESAPIEHLDEHDEKLRGQADAVLKAHGTNRDDPTFAGSSNEQIISAFQPAKARGGRIQHFDDGGAVEGGGQDPGLKALLNGLTMKVAGEKEDTNSPMTNTGGELLGGAASTALALAALRNKTAREFMLHHPQWTGSGVGAIAGGIAGEEGSGNAIPGALSGAVLGQVGAGLGRGASARLMQLADRVGGIENTPGMRRAVGAINADTNFDDLSARMAKDKALGVNPTIAEAAGPRSTGLLGAAMRRDTPEGSELLGSLQERQAGSGVRAGDTVNNAMAPDDYLAKTAELRNNLYTKAAPLYDEAFKQFPSLESPALSQFMTTPAGQEAVQRAVVAMKNRQLPVAVPGQNGVSLQFLDQVKRSLDDMIMREEGTGASYQANDAGRTLRQLRSSLVGELDKSTMGPQGQPSPYRAARDQYAGDLDIMDSLRAGREMFPKQTPDEVRDTISKLDWSARDAYRTGVATGILNNIGNMGGNRNAAAAVIANPNLQQKIMAIFDDPKQGQRFIESLQRQADTYQTGKGLVKSGEKGMELSLQPSSVSQMLRAQLMRKGTAGEIADTMSPMAQDPDVKEKIARLRSIADRLRVQKDASTAIGAATAGGLATAATPSPQGQ